ncbi:FHA domain-containing protein, partial [Candidatus Sumerlaeota bacterium]|nr:FHA domain-containing protein [Candidatus Sumerlaeota bacterium]
MPRNVEDREPKITLAISKSGAQATEQTFGGTCVTGGRSPDNMLRVDDDYVSSRHFRFDWDGTAYGFRDLGSSNGSLVNGTRVREATLKEGDVITVGVTRLTVRKVHAPLPDPAFSLLRSIPPSLGTVELPKAGLGELGRTEPAPLQEESDPGLAPPLALPKAEQGIVEEMFFEKVINLIHGDLQALWKQHDVLAGRLDALAADQHSEEIEVAHTAIHNSLRSVEAAMRNLEKDQRRLKALHSTAVLMNRVTDLRGRLNAILDLAIEIMQADCGFLLLYEERTDKISVALNRGMGLLDTADSEQLCTILAQSPTPSMSIAREAMRTRQCMVVLDLR